MRSFKAISLVITGPGWAAGMGRLELATHRVTRLFKQQKKHPKKLSKAAWEQHPQVAMEEQNSLHTSEL